VSEKNEITRLCQRYRHLPPMTRPDERASFARLRILENVGGPRPKIDTLQDAIMRSNVRFVATVVLSYDRRSKFLAVDDLMSEGMVGLMEAMTRFDPSRNCKFITYAVWWIRNTIISALMQAYTITPSQSFIDKLRKMEKEKKSLEQELGRHITDRESFELSEMRKDFVEAYIAHTSVITSLDMPLFFIDNDLEGSTTLRDFIRDETIQPSDDAMVDAELLLDVREVVNSIDGLRERFIVQSYHGIDGPAMVLEDIGKSLGLTRERVRQIYWMALRKLSRNKVLASHRKDSY